MNTSTEEEESYDVVQKVLNFSVTDKLSTGTYVEPMWKS